MTTWITGLGFGGCGIYGIVHLAQHGTIARVMGFSTYGEGPFERIGIKTTVPLMSAFVAVCAAECVVGALLWRDRRQGEVLGLALLPVESVFWIGFALPIPPALAAIRTVSILRRRKARKVAALGLR
jgi:hypothetical protein